MLKVLPTTVFNNVGSAKCAEIYCQSPTDFTILCAFCQMKSFEFEDFLLHFKNIHFENDHFKSEEFNLECTPEVNVKCEVNKDEDEEDDDEAAEQALNNSHVSYNEEAPSALLKELGVEREASEEKLIKWQSNELNDFYDSHSEDDADDQDVEYVPDEDDYFGSECSEKTDPIVPPKTTNDAATLKMRKGTETSFASATIKSCICQTCSMIRSTVSLDSVALLESFRNISQLLLLSDAVESIVVPATIEKSNKSFVVPATIKKPNNCTTVKLVKNQQIYINVDDRRAAYMAAGGVGARLVRKLLLRLVPLEELKTKTARGSGPNGLSKELLDAVTLCANDLIRKSNKKQPDKAKHQKPLGRSDITKVVNTFLQGIREGYNGAKKFRVNRTKSFESST